MGPQQQCLPAERRPPLPRRGFASGIRDTRMRQRDRTGHPRQGRRAHSRRPAGRRRTPPARGGNRGRRLPLQEQHRLGGQLLRLPRELSRGPARGVLPARGHPHSVPRHPSAAVRRGQGAADPARRGLLRQPAGRAHLGGRQLRDDPLPADHQHPRRTARGRRALPPAACHRRRLEHVRDDHAAEGRRHRPGAAHDRGGHGDAGPDPGEPDPGDPRGQPRHHRPAQGAPGQRPRGLRAGGPAGVLREGRGLRASAAASAPAPSSRSWSCGAARWTRSRRRTSTGSAPRSTG